MPIFVHSDRLRMKAYKLLAAALFFSVSHFDMRSVRNSCFTLHCDMLDRSFHLLFLCIPMRYMCHWREAIPVLCLLLTWGCVRAVLGGDADTRVSAGEDLLAKEAQNQRADHSAVGAAQGMLSGNVRVCVYVRMYDYHIAAAIKPLTRFESVSFYVSAGGGAGGQQPYGIWYYYAALDVGVFLAVVITRKWSYRIGDLT